MFIFGVLAALASAGAGGFLAWENRDVMVRVHLGNHAWSGHLYGVLILGALLACWFLLGLSCIHLRLRERRQRRAARAAAAAGSTAPAESAAPAGSPAMDVPDRRPHRRTGRHVGAVGLR